MGTATTKRTAAMILFSTLMALFSLIYVYPVLLVVLNSMKNFKDITTNALAFPSHLELVNFAKAITLMHYGRLFINTLIVTVLGTGGCLIVSSMAGYKLSRTKTRSSWLVFLVCIAPMMIPFQSFMIALVKVAKSLHLIGSTFGLSVIYWGLGAPLSIFLYHGFVKTVPTELDDCAVIDGAGAGRAFFQVILPLLRPVTVSVMVLNAMWMWNDFLLPLLILNGSPSSLTLQLAVYNFFSQYTTDWNWALAGVVMTITPAIVFYVIVQKQILKGMVVGAVKA